MDLLRAAYSDDNSEYEKDFSNDNKKILPVAGNKNTERRKVWEESNVECNYVAAPYISKRQRREAQTSDTPSTTRPSAVVGSISDSKVPSHIRTQLRQFGEVNAHHNRIPKGLPISLTGHTKAVNAVEWSPTHGHLLASGGMDHIAYIWNVWNREGQNKACVLSHHNAAIKDLQWSKQGLHLLTCGYDQTSRLTDVETSSQVQVFREEQVVSVVKFHPQEFHLFLSGGSKGTIRLWDIRMSKVIREYLRGLGPIMDIDFSYDGKNFISSSDNSQTNCSEKSIVVWDFQTQVPLSKQVYVEAYTCPSIRYHPVENSFVAQSNGTVMLVMLDMTHELILLWYKRFLLFNYCRIEVLGFQIFEARH
ncbi:hypothetical protein SUGI_0664620 [Cryptomeria japonica]|nr:hypothetical protein SUGI_0664620 [Cryptomeria japonica]